MSSDAAAHSTLHPPCALQKHPYFAATLRAMGRDASTTPLVLDGTTVGQLQSVRRAFGPLSLRWVPRGPLWTIPLTAAQKRAALRHSAPRAPLWLVNCETAADTILWGRNLRVAPGQHLASLDLGQSHDIRLARQHGKWRNRLRHAQSGPLISRIRRFDPLMDAPLLDLERTRRKTRHYAGYPPIFTRTWAQVHPHATLMASALDKGETLAFVLCLLHGPAATYHIGWSGTRGRMLSAHNLLMWEMSNWLAARGFTRFDLGLAHLTHTPGLTHFKTGFGACLHRLGPTILTRRPA